MITFEQIIQANNSIKTTDIKGKEYAEVPQRIKAFRMIYPTGFITTEIVSLENGVCIIRASVGYYDESGAPFVIGTGTAYEKEGSTFINKTSYIENAETSAVGRALGMAGFGIDVSVASAEEVQNAMLNQGDNKNPNQGDNKNAILNQGDNKPKEFEEMKASRRQISILSKVYTGAALEKLLTVNNVKSLDDLSFEKAADLLIKLDQKQKGAANE